MKFKTPSERSEYYIEPPLYRHAVSWCLCYQTWKDRLRLLTDTSKGIRYDLDKVQSSGDSDPTFVLAEKRAEYSQKVKLLEDTVKDVAPEIYDYLLLGVTMGLNYYQMQCKGIPCGSKYYYRKRQQLYCEIAKKI